MNRDEDSAGRPASGRGASVPGVRNQDGPAPVQPASSDSRTTKRGTGRRRSGAFGPLAELSDDAQVAILVEAVQAGDQEAFEQLVSISYLDVFTLALRLCRSEQDALDVTQEAYLRAYRSIDKFRGDAKFSTWMYRITANCASTYLKKRTRHRHEALEEQGEPADTEAARDPVGRAENAELRSRLDVALRTLAPKLRAVVVLRDIYDLSHEDIASELGISVSASKVRLHRARQQLRSELMPDIEVASRDL